ncbi:MAG TPA: hypothetical protein VM915_09705, partial [Verrucomicrobiae bacterium]|nr:hypothetical protein [Verrucomicrobiae bacterium]
MSLSTTDNRFVYDGDATTTIFSFPRKVIEAAHLDVYLYDEDDETWALQTLNSHYTFAGSGLSNGIYASATITFSTAPGTDKKVVIYRDPALTQEADFTGETNVLNALNRFADRTAMQLQRVHDRIDRTVRLGDGDYQTGLGALEEGLIGKAGYIFAVNDDEDGVEFVANNGSSTLVTAEGSTTARSLEDRFAEVYDLEDWGVTSSTTAAQNTTALNAIFAAIASAGGKAIVQLPEYTVTVDGQLTLNASNVTIRGKGRKASIIHSTYVAGPAFVLGNSSTQTVEISFQECGFTNVAGGTFFWSKYLRGLYFHRVYW